MPTLLDEYCSALRFFCLTSVKKLDRTPCIAGPPPVQTLLRLFPSNLSAAKKSSKSFSTSLAFVVVSHGRQKSSSIVLLWMYRTNNLNWEKFSESTDSSSCRPNTSEALIFSMSWDLISQPISAIRDLKVSLDKETYITFDFAPSPNKIPAHSTTQGFISVSVMSCVFVWS